MGKVIGIISIKGGVGKTTVASSIAADLANNKKKKVLLIDANYSAPNLSEHMDAVEMEKSIHDVLAGKARIQTVIQNRFGVDVVPGNPFCNFTINPLKLKDKIAKVKEEYDFVIIDSSPCLNEEILSTMLASDNLFVVTTPDSPTLTCSLRAANLAKSRGRPVSGIIINKIREPRFELESREIEEATGIPVISRIPDDKTSTRALFTRIPIPVYDRKSGFAKEIDKISMVLTGEKEARPFWKKILSLGFSREEVNREIVRDSLYKRVFSE